MLVDLASRGVRGDVAAKALEQAGLAVNKNQIPFDAHPPEAPSGLRLSANAGSARGFGVPEFQAIGGWIDRALANPSDRQAIASIRSEEHPSELQSLMRISYAVFCLKKKTHNILKQDRHQHT